MRQAFFSASSQNVISELCDKDMSKRLGCRGRGIEEVKVNAQHDVFTHVAQFFEQIAKARVACGLARSARAVCGCRFAIPKRAPVLVNENGLRLKRRRI
eukprot:1793711-Pleurochrysis_carterae.AAC.1